MCDFAEWKLSRQTESSSWCSAFQLLCTLRLLPFSDYIKSQITPKLLPFLLPHLEVSLRILPNYSHSYYPIWRLVSEYSFLLMFKPSGPPPPKGRCCTTPILRLLPDYSQATPILSLLLLIIAYSHIQIIHKLLIFSNIPVLGLLPDYYYCL